MKKPVTPKAHGIIDYALSGIQLIAPALLGVNSKSRTTYQALGTGFLGINALTDTEVGLKKLIPFKGHQKADASFLAGLSLLTFTSMINKDKKALAFHLGFLALAVTHYVLTDYNSKSIS
jgi:hypothetical protein